MCESTAAYAPRTIDTDRDCHSIVPCLKIVSVIREKEKAFHDEKIFDVSVKAF